MHEEGRCCEWYLNMIWLMVRCGRQEEEEEEEEEYPWISLSARQVTIFFKKRPFL